MLPLFSCGDDVPVILNGVIGSTREEPRYECPFVPMDAVCP